MTRAEREPRPDELLAMAYVDGELDAADARAFEQRLAREPALGREVAELRGLALLARRVAPPEPADHEWRRIERGAAHKVGMPLGLALVAAGVLGLLALGLAWLWASPLPLALKVCAACLCAGLAILFLLALRARIATLPYDPYTKVQR